MEGFLWFGGNREAALGLPEKWQIIEQGQGCGHAGGKVAGNFCFAQTLACYGFR